MVDTADGATEVEYGSAVEEMARPAPVQPQKRPGRIGRLRARPAGEIIGKGFLISLWLSWGFDLMISLSSWLAMRPDSSLRANRGQGIRPSLLPTFRASGWSIVQQTMSGVLAATPLLVIGAGILASCAALTGGWTKAVRFSALFVLVVAFPATLEHRFRVHLEGRELASELVGVATNGLMALAVVFVTWRVERVAAVAAVASRVVGASATGSDQGLTNG